MVYAFLKPIFLVSIFLFIFFLPCGFCEDICRYLSQQGGLNTDQPISLDNFIYHRHIIFQSQTGGKPVLIDISYQYEAIDSDSIVIVYQRSEKRFWGGDYLSFKEPVKEVFDLPFNSKKQAVLQIKEEFLGYYAVVEGGYVRKGSCGNEPGLTVFLSVDANQRLLVQLQ